MGHRIGRRVGAAATGVALEGDAGIDEFERIGPVGEDAACIEGPYPIVDREKPLWVFERVGIGGHALLGEQRGAQPIARRLPDMERLRHGAEIGLDAARHRGRECERMGEFIRAQAEQVSASRRAAEGPERRGRVPAFVVVMEIHRACETGFALDAGGVSSQERLSGVAGADRPQGRQDRRRRMAADRIVAIVEIERMRRDAVDERGAEHIEMFAAPEDQRRPGRGGLAQRARHHRRRIVVHARQGDADGVEDGVFRHRDRFGRKRLECHLADSIRE